MENGKEEKNYGDEKGRKWKVVLKGKNGVISVKQRNEGRRKEEEEDKSKRRKVRIENSTLRCAVYSHA